MYIELKVENNCKLKLFKEIKYVLFKNFITELKGQKLIPV
jgi:hypothetical protein